MNIVLKEHKYVIDSNCVYINWVVLKEHKYIIDSICVYANWVVLKEDKEVRKNSLDFNSHENSINLYDYAKHKNTKFKSNTKVINNL